MQTPDNAAYYHAAYVAVAVIYGLYAASLWWRGRRARAERGTHGSERRG